MKQIVVLSGKGGTGKTSVAAALADLASRGRRVVLVDADADAANLGLLLDPKLRDVVPFYGAEVAVVDPELCLGCGACADVCRFDAISPGQPCTVDATACEGCHACALECSEDAIQMERVRAGSQQHSQTRYGPLFHGDLLPGQESTGKLVAALRQAAAQRARETPTDLILIDGPPGIGCPAIAASTGTDFALLVTEPSLSALHDLERILGMVWHFQIPALACLNKADLHAGLARKIRDFLEEQGVPLLGEIPFHLGLEEAVERGCPVTKLGESVLDRVFADLWLGVRRALDGRLSEVISLS